MSTVSALAGSPNWAAQVNQAAAQASTHVDRDGDRDNNKPDTAAEATKDLGATPHKLNISA